MRAALLLAIAACHVTTEVESIRPGAVHREPHGEPTPRAPARAIGDDGKLRFIEPLDCASDEIVEQDVVLTTAIKPNIATFVVGVIATAAGGIATARGAVGGDNGITAIGVGTLVVALPFAIGPMLGDREIDRAGPPRAPLRHPGGSQPCGDRPVAATHATLDVKGIQIHGRVGADGSFAIPLFQWIDAFATPTGAWDVHASVATAAGDKAITAVLEGDAVARGAKGFLAHADFDAAIEPFRIVPSLTASTAVVLVDTDDGPAARVTLAVQNAGPGDSYALRGAIETNVPALDGRIIYVGRVAKNSTLARDLVIPLARDAAASLRGATIEPRGAAARCARDRAGCARPIPRRCPVARRRRRRRRRRRAISSLTPTPTPTPTLTLTPCGS